MRRTYLGFCCSRKALDCSESWANPFRFILFEELDRELSADSRGFTAWECSPVKAAFRCTQSEASVEVLWGVVHGTGRRKGCVK